MTDVTVLFVDGTSSSTAISLMEDFCHDRSLWNLVKGPCPVPGLRLTTASVNGSRARDQPHDEEEEDDEDSKDNNKSNDDNDNDDDGEDGEGYLV
jgi:hypothetical protein